MDTRFIFYPAIANQEFLDNQHAQFIEMESQSKPIQIDSLIIPEGEDKVKNSTKKEVTKSKEKEDTDDVYVCVPECKNGGLCYKGYFSTL